MKIPATILVAGENVRVMITTARGPGGEATYELFDPEKYNGQKDLYKDPLLQKWLSEQN